MIDKSDCSRDFSKKITKKHPDTHKKIRNCNEFENSLNFAKVSKEFKLDAISLVLDQGLTIAEAARSLEIRANMLGRWIKENEADNNGQAFRGNGKLTPDQEEIRRLKIENKQLKFERQILKGAAVFFAKETK